jgi:hypothetical protein
VKLPDGLDWVHDCGIVDYRVKHHADDVASITWTFDCPHDLGYEPWNGKYVRLDAIGVLAMKHFVAGGQIGFESINWIRAKTELLVAEIANVPASMRSSYPIEFTILYHSGSVHDVICRELRADVVSSPRSVS